MCQNSKFWQYGCIMLWRRQDESCLKIPDCSPWLVESWPSSVYCFCADLAPDFPAVKLTACRFLGCQCHTASPLTHRAGCPGLSLSKHTAIGELSGMRKSTRGNRGLNSKAASGPVVCGARKYEYIAGCGRFQLSKGVANAVEHILSKPNTNSYCCPQRLHQ